MDIRLRVGHVLPGLAIIGGGITLSKVVGLNLGRVAANTFLLFQLASGTMYTFHCLATYPVNLVQVIRLHDHTADHTGTRGRLHLDLYVTKQEVVLGLDGRRITLLGDGEGSTLVVIVKIASSHSPAVEGTGTLGKVRAESGGSQAIIVGAGFLIMVSACWFSHLDVGNDIKTYSWSGCISRRSERCRMGALQSELRQRT